MLPPDGEYIYKQVRTVQEKDQYLSVQTIVYNLLLREYGCVMSSPPSIDLIVKIPQDKTTIGD
jgi:hypothetical protein